MSNSFLIDLVEDLMSALYSNQFDMLLSTAVVNMDESFCHRTACKKVKKSQSPFTESQYLQNPKGWAEVGQFNK